jgi:hypothetical protein
MPEGDRSRPWDTYPRLTREYDRLLALRDDHLPLVRAAARGDLYAVDLFLVTVAERSFHLVSGHLTAMEDRVRSPVPRLKRERGENVESDPRCEISPPKMYDPLKSPPKLLPACGSHVTPHPRVHPHSLTCGVWVLTVFPSPPLGEIGERSGSPPDPPA